MIKKIIPVFVLVMFLSLVITPTVSAVECSCACNCLFYNGVSQTPGDKDGDCEFSGSHIYYKGKMETSACKQICEEEGTTWFESDITCNSNMLQGESSGSSSSAKLADPLRLNGDIDNLWIRIIKALLGFVAIASLVTFVYAGFIFLISTGNAEKVKKAKDTVIYAVLGIFLSIASYSILSFILNILERK